MESKAVFFRGSTGNNVDDWSSHRIVGVIITFYYYLIASVIITQYLKGMNAE